MRHTGQRLRIKIRDLSKYFYLLLIFTLPFEVAITEQTDFFTLSLTNIILIFTFLLVLFTGRYKIYTEELFLYILILTEMLSLAVSNYVNSNELVLRSTYTLVGYMMIIFCTTHTLKTSKDVQNIFNAIIMSTIILSILAILKALGVLSIGDSPLKTMEFMGSIDVPKTIPLPMSYGLYGIIMCTSLNYIIINYKFSKLKLLYLLLILASLVISQSRNAFLSESIAITYIIYSSYYFSKITKVITILFVISVAFVFILYSSLVSIESVHERIKQYNTSLDIFYANPLFGYGQVKVQEIMNDLHNNPVHNFYLNRLAETGITGILLLLIIILYIILLCFNLNKLKKLSFIDYRSIFASLIMILIALNFYPGESIKITYVLIGIIIFLLNFKNKNIENINNKNSSAW